MRAIFTIILLALVCPPIAARAATNTLFSPEYAQWTNAREKMPTTSSMMGNVGLKLIVTTFSGEVEPSALTNMTLIERTIVESRRETTGFQISTNGQYYCFYNGALGGRSCCNKRLSEDELRHLDVLLSQLPDDGSRLPPPGQRIALQVLKDAHWQMRVYNRAKVPKEVAAILSLIENPYDKP